MNLLQRRLFAEFSKVFALSLAVLLLFILMGQAMRLRDMLLGLELGMGDTLRLFAYLTPSLLQYIMPVACMLAVFLTFLRMSSDRELIALKAGGVSLYQMLPGTSAVQLSLYVVFPVGHAVSGRLGAGHFRTEVLDIASSRARVVLRPGVFNQDIPNKVFFADEWIRKGERWRRCWWRINPVRTCASPFLRPWGAWEWTTSWGSCCSCSRTDVSIPSAGDAVTTLGFEEYVVRLQLSEMFRSLDMGPLKPGEMTWSQLMGAG